MVKQEYVYTPSDISEIEKLRDGFKSLILSYQLFYSRCNRRPTRLLCEYGEILVQLELLKRGFHLDLPGGQSKADLTILNEKNGEAKKVEIKTSSYKTEGFGEGWGFALNEKKSQKSLAQKDFSYFDYLVCIGLDKVDKISPHFYIFTKEEIAQHGEELKNTKTGRFKSASHGLIIPERLSGKENLPTFEVNLKGNNNYLDRWDKIK